MSYDDNNLLAKAFDYYDKQKQKHKNIYEKGITIEINEENKNDMVLPTFRLYKDNKVILSGTYNTVGLYFPDTQEWVWGWAIQWTDHGLISAKNRAILTRKILEYGLDISYPGEDHREIVFHTQLRMDLISCRVKIEHPLQLEKLLAVAQYITHSEMVYRIDSEYHNTITYCLLNPLTDTN